jgi:hypothetical protein
MLASAMGRRPEHGQYTSYAKGCRCRRCKDAWAAYIRAYKARANGGGYYRDKTVTVRVRLTPLAERILRSAEQRTGQQPDDVIEAALRTCGASVQFAA